MQIKDINERLVNALGADGLDLERRSRNAGRRVAASWEKASKFIRDISHLPSHEERLREVEKDTGELAKDVEKIKIWLQDIDHRTQLLEHFHNYDFDDIRCHECDSPMRVKRNR